MKNNNNAAYWRIREANAKARYIKEEIPYLEYISNLYNDMLRNIQSEINNFFVKYARDKGITLAEAKRRADKLDIRAYEQKAKKYVNERNFSKRANEEMRLYNLTMKVNRLELLKANIGLEITTCNNDYEKFLNEKLEKRAIDEIKRQAGILGKTIVQNAKQIKSIVNGSFYSADFSHRIWGNSSLLKAEIEKQLVRGLIGGKHPRELAQNLRKTITSGRYEAERLMRTELARVQTDAQKESYKTNNVDEYEYIGGQSRICPICAELDGKRFKVSEMRVGENAPPMHPNCRCATSAAIDENDEVEHKEGQSKITYNLKSFGSGKDVTEYFRSDESYQKWKASLSESEKEAILNYTGFIYKDINDFNRKIFNWSVDGKFGRIIKKAEEFIKNVPEIKQNPGESLFAYKKRRDKIIPPEYQNALFSKKIAVETTDVLDNIFRRFELKDDIKTYRAVNSDALPQFKKLEDLIGKSYSDSSFVSTSPSLESKAINKDYILEISVPKGVGNGIYLEDFTLVSGEYELLLPRNKEYIIKGIKIKNGKKYIMVEMKT